MSDETTGIRTTPSGRTTPPQGRARRLAARWAALGLLLLTLYFMAWQTTTAIQLRDDLSDAQSATLIARERAQDDRTELNLRLDEVQDALDKAVEANRLLREQLTLAGLIPVVPEEAS